MAKVVQNCKIIIWDVYDGTLTNIGGTQSKVKRLHVNQNLFGSAMILLVGDFHQTLSFIPRSTATDEINACLKS